MKSERVALTLEIRCIRPAARDALCDDKAEKAKGSTNCFDVRADFFQLKSNGVTEYLFNIQSD